MLLAGCAQYQAQQYQKEASDAVAECKEQTKHLTTLSENAICQQEANQRIMSKYNFNDEDLINEMLAKLVYYARLVDDGKMTKEEAKLKFAEAQTERINKVHARENAALIANQQRQANANAQLLMGLGLLAGSQQPSFAPPSPPVNCVSQWRGGRQYTQCY